MFLVKLLQFFTRVIQFYQTVVFYNGRKEKEINEAKSNDIGNCSVCWKFNTTPKHLKTRARNLIDEYCRTFYETPTHLTHADVDLETSFVKWLYEESIN